jgi:hypothetical protein
VLNGDFNFAGRSESLRRKPYFQERVEARGQRHAQKVTFSSSHSWFGGTL